MVRTFYAMMLTAWLFANAQSADATKLMGIHVIDNATLMVHLRDGEVHYRDNAIGRSAYLGHTFVEGDDSMVVFGERLNTEKARQAQLWKVSSDDDRRFKKQQPSAVYRKSKPMNTDHTLSGELDHWLFLRLPRPMRQGCHYRVSIPKEIHADRLSAEVCFDVWNTPSEALHVNMIGYVPSESVHAADLYLWMGDGGQRDYMEWEGRDVYLYNVATKEKTSVGKVAFWKPASASENEAGRKALVATDVWNIDFRAAEPGRYRLVVEDIGCSMDFDISNDIYFEPYRYSLRGYYYMRIGEPADPEHVWPVPRQPRFIPGKDPEGLVVYKTDLHPWHPEWRQLRMDVWDEPHFKAPEKSLFWQHRLPGNPVNTIVRGGHSDAMDWDRHLAHVSNIYDLLLPYLLTRGRLSEDRLGIRESDNGIPDLIDEARNEVDFFLSIRDGEAYSQGMTNPSNDWKVMFQAGSTTMAAWANSANCAMLAEAFRVMGCDSLRRYYTDEAVKAFRFASQQDNQMLDDSQGIGVISMRGRDFRQMAAAYLYNLTGETEWEQVFAEESMVKDGQSALFRRGRQGYCQYWAAVAYLTCPQRRHFPELYQQLKLSTFYQAQQYNICHMVERPSRRVANDTSWQTSQNLHLVMLAHYLSDNDERRRELEHVMLTEAGWGLGRNPGNIVEMTGLGQRHITDAYSTGRNDGAPGTHPGQTPFNGTGVWTAGNGGDARILLRQCYPSWDDGGWPRQESFFNQRYLWVNSEFTPRETMRGKMALLAYLYGIRE